MELVAGGGGERTWPHGFSQAEHIVHSTWYFDDVEVVFREAEAVGLRRIVKTMHTCREIAILWVISISA